MAANPLPLRVPTLAQIWHEEPELRGQLAAYGWGNSEIRPRLIRAAAEHFHMREKTLRAREQGLRRIRDLPLVPAALLTDLVRAFLFANHRELLAAFLDGLGIEHDHGGLDHQPEAPGPGNVRRAVEGLSSFPPVTVRLYLTAFYWSHGQWTELGDILAAPQLESPSSSANPGQDGVATQEPLMQREALPSPEVQTTLDDVLILMAVASVAGAEGSLEPDRLDDLIGEVVDLSPSRHRSYFHRGYVAALRRQPLNSEFDGVNDQRRAWYMAGAVVGLARYRAWGAIVQLYRDGNLEQLGNLGGASAQANRHVVRALVQEGSVSEAMEYLDPDAAAATGCFSTLYSAARGLMQARRFGEAQAVLEYLARPAETAPALSYDSMYWDVQRLRAHCLQWQGLLEPARELFRTLLGTGNVGDRAAALTDLALANTGFRGLYDFRVGVHDSELGRRLEPIRPDLETAVTESGAGQAHAHYCLGVLDLIRGNYRAAVSHLEPALARFRAPGGLYDIFELPQRCAFYLATALLAELDPVRASFALDLADEAMAQGFRPPGPLLRMAAEGLILTSKDPLLLERFAGAVERRIGDGGLDSLIEADKPTCAALLRRLLARGQDENRRSQDRMRDLLLTLRQTSDQGLTALQEEAIGALQALALIHPALPEAAEFVARLEAVEPTEYDPVLSPAEAALLAGDLWLAGGEKTRAARSWEQAGFRLLREARFGAVEEAAALADRIDELNIGHSSAGLRHKTPGTPPTPLSEQRAVPVRIAVVGGDERLSANRGKIEERVRKEDPAVSIEFHVTNWSSNIGPQFDAMRPALQRCDAIVVLRNIRTDMGCRLRREFPTWVGCPIYSPTGISASVLLAARFARNHRARAGVP